MNQNELMHYGVLGMKWGIRRYQPYSVKPRGSGKGGKEIGAAKKEKSKGDIIREDRITANKNRRQLSDKELDYRIGRLKKEQELNRLTREDVQPGQEAAKRVMKDVGGKAMKAVATGALIYGGKVILEKVFGPGAAAFIPKQKK